MRQFRPAKWGSLYEQWLATIQETPVQEYRRKFIETTAPLDQISESLLLGHFINGLKEDVKVEVRLLSPMNLEHAMEIVVKVEEKQRIIRLLRQRLRSVKTGTYSTHSSRGLHSSYSPSGMPTSPSFISKSWVSGSSESQASVYSPKSVTYSRGVSKPLGKFKRLTEKELQEKKAKDMCF